MWLMDTRKHGHNGHNGYSISIVCSCKVVSCIHGAFSITVASRSARPTSNCYYVLWVVAKGVILPRPFGWSEKLEALSLISEFSVDHCLLNAKGTMPKYPTVFLHSFLNENLAWPCHALLGSPACLRNFFELVWIIA